jgi:hypothetical protein
MNFIAAHNPMESQMKPAPEASVIKTVSSPIAQYALLIAAALIFTTVAAAWLPGGLSGVLSEVGRLMVGAANQ